MKLFRSLFKKKKQISILDDPIVQQVIDEVVPNEELEALEIPTRQAEFRSVTSLYAMKQMSYTIPKDEYEEEVLTSEKFFDVTGRLIHHIDREADPTYEKTFLYDDTDRLIEEVETSKGEELNRDHFLYEEERTVHHLLISGELYQVTITRFEAAMFLETVFQNGIEAKRQEKVIDRDTTTIKFYEQRRLEETQVQTYDEETLTAFVKSYDRDNQLAATAKDTYNQAGLIVSRQVFNEKDELASEELYEYNNDVMLVKEIHNNLPGKLSCTITYEYDEKNNLRKTEARAPEGYVIDVSLQNHDEQGQVIEESGMKNGDKFHYKHVYELKG